MEITGSAIPLLIAALVVILGLLTYQLSRIRRSLEARALQQTYRERISILSDQLETEALHSAQDKFFEHELYKRDVLFPEIEELTLRERRAITSAYLIELMYFQNLFFQATRGVVPSEQSQPLTYMRCMMDAPQRRYWKDYLRQSNQYPADFVAHVDAIVKKYDQVEEIMDRDQDAEFEAVVLEVFDVPPPPDWVRR